MDTSGFELVVQPFGECLLLHSNPARLEQRHEMEAVQQEVIASPRSLQFYVITSEQKASLQVSYM